MLKRWLTSKDLIDRWQAEPFEILEAHKNGLPFYVKSGKLVTYPLNSEDHKPEKLNSAQRRELEKYDEYLLDNIFLDYEPFFDPFDQAMGEDVEVAKFKLTDVEAYEQKHEISPVDVVTDETKQKDIFPQDDISFPDVTSWNDVFIKVVTGGNPYERGIEIKLPDKDWIGILYEELKLKPDSVLVEKLELLAKGESVNNKKSAYATDISRLRTLLGKIFPNIKGDPIPFNRKKYNYKAAFKIEETEAIVD